MKVLSDILAAVDRADVALAQQYLYAAFDTVDHEILLERIHRAFGVADRVHSSLPAGSRRMLLDGPNQSAVVTSCPWPFQLNVASLKAPFWGRFSSFFTRPICNQSSDATSLHLMCMLMMLKFMIRSTLPVWTAWLYEQAVLSATSTVG